MKEVNVIALDKINEIALEGEIDASLADAFFAEVIECYQKNPAPIFFDCTKLDFIDSTTLGTFVKILKRVKMDGNTITLQNLQPKIKKLFLICSLDSIMEIK